jgi:hypothetical protein
MELRPAQAALDRGRVQIEAASDQRVLTSRSRSRATAAAIPAPSATILRRMSKMGLPIALKRPVVLERVARACATANRPPKFAVTLR